MFPSIAEYNQAIQISGGRAFRHLSNLSFIPSKIAPFKSYSFGSGSYAVVFKATDDFQEYAIKCFISAEQENIDRYRNIDNYLRGVSASWVTNMELLEDEIKIFGKYYPVVKMDWVEGKLLNNFITEILDDNTALTVLQQEVIRISESLESLGIGHGDIECGNLIVTKDENGKSVLKLIDYDGMYIPDFSNKRNLERGRPEFQHPNRSQVPYNEKIDRFSFWVILCAIEALKYDKDLWLDVLHGGFNTSDNLLFVGDDFKSFDNSKLVSHLYGLNKSSLSYYLDKLKTFCNSSPESVEFPALFNGTEKDTVNSGIQLISHPAELVVQTSALQKIGITLLSKNNKRTLDKTVIISYGSQTHKIEVSEDTTAINAIFQEEKDVKTIEIEYFHEKPEAANPLITPGIKFEKKATSKKALLAMLFLGVIIITGIGYYLYSKNHNAPASAPLKTVAVNEVKTGDSLPLTERKILSPQLNDSKDCDQWRKWFADPESFDGEITPGITLALQETLPYVLQHKKNKLLVKMLWETYGQDRLEAILNFDWTDLESIDRLITKSQYRDTILNRCN